MSVKFKRLVLPALITVNGLQVLSTPCFAAFEFGQVALVKPYDTRVAADIVPKRNMLLTVKPESNAKFKEGSLLVYNTEGVIASIKLTPPSDFPPFLDQKITAYDLGKLATDAWFAVVPWQLVSGNMSFIATFTDSSGCQHVESFMKNVILPESSFTIRRANVVMFDGEHPAPLDRLLPARVLNDYIASLPLSRMTQADYSQVALPYVILNKDGVGTRFDSMQDVADAGLTHNEFYSVLKHQVAQQLSAAQQGRGLFMTSGDDSGSHFSDTTVVSSGAYKNQDGKYDDMNKIGVAGGWVGWSAIWNGDSGGNAYAHEIGHSFRLKHWTTKEPGPASIQHEYPSGGLYSDMNPTPVDSTANTFRTWYRVDHKGPVLDENGQKIGTTDPMNSGHGMNDSSVFPRFLPYHQFRTQQFFSGNRPVIRNINGKPDYYKWNACASNFETYDPGENYSAVEYVDVPVASVYGTFGSADEAQQIYPILYNRSGNTFARSASLSESKYDAASLPMYLQISYEDGSTEYAHINSAVTDAYQRFSVNIPMSKQPKKVELYNAGVMKAARDFAVQIPADTPEFSTISRSVQSAAGKHVPYSYGVGKDVTTPDEIWPFMPTTGGLDFDIESPASLTHNSDHSIIALNVMDDSGVAHDIQIKTWLTTNNDPSSTRNLLTTDEKFRLGDEVQFHWHVLPFGIARLTNVESPIITVKDDQGVVTQARMRFDYNVVGIPGNIALNKPSSQSSNYRNFYSHLANDGDFTTMNHTGCGQGEWLEIDLQKQYDLTLLKLAHRDSWSSRLNGSQVVTLDENRNELWRAELRDEWTHQFASGFKTRGFTGVNTRYIRIEQNDCVHWTEIEAFIDPMYGDQEESRPGLYYGTVPGSFNKTHINPKTSVTYLLPETEKNNLPGRTTQIFNGYINIPNGKISFRENYDNNVLLMIDGVVVLEDTVWDQPSDTGELVFSPGWHRLELRLANTGGPSGIGNREGFGFSYDPEGGTNWQHLEDDGTGSLLRTELKR